MRVVNDMKFSVKDISPLGVALGMTFVIVGSAFLKSGVQGLAYGLGFRGKVTVFK